MAVLTDLPTKGFALGQSINVSQATAAHRVGARFTDGAGREFFYCRANAAITGQGYVCSIDTLGDATLLTTAVADTYPIFVVVCATNGAPADDDYLWGCLSNPPGPLQAELGLRVSANAGADSQLWTTSTAGQLDSTPGTAPIENVKLRTIQGGSAGVNTTAQWHFMRRGLVGT